MIRKHRASAWRSPRPSLTRSGRATRDESIVAAMRPGHRTSHFERQIRAARPRFWNLAPWGLWRVLACNPGLRSARPGLPNPAPLGLWRTVPPTSCSSWTPGISARLPGQKGQIGPEVVYTDFQILFIFSRSCLSRGICGKGRSRDRATRVELCGVNLHDGLFVRFVALDNSSPLTAHVPMSGFYGGR
jgi:hypothetical protein